MAVAAIAHVYVFSVEQYQYLPISSHGDVTCEIKTEVKVNDRKKEEPAVVETKEMHVEAPGTSIRESVQDVVLVGGKHVSCIMKYWGYMYQLDFVDIGITFEISHCSFGKSLKINNFYWVIGMIP